MKRILAALFIVVFAVSLAVGLMTSPTEAKPPCFATCLNGTYWVCCPVGGGQYECYWDGPCDWPGWIP